MSQGDEQTQLLLIGPEFELLELLDEVLTDEGYLVQTASAASNIEEHLASPDYDIIVCDEMVGEQIGRASCRERV